MNKFSLFVFFSIFSSALMAQISSDALLFSERLQPNTARSMAVGGALGALGADMSSLNSNPAGLAVYRGSEFSISPGLQFANIQSQFLADSTLPRSSNNRLSFNLGSVGLVLAQEQSTDWRYVNFGLSFGRTASFNRTYSFSGTSTGSRIINFTQEANAANALPDDLDPFEERLAWDAYFIDNPGGGTDYVGSVVDSNRAYIQKSQLVRQSGGINELNIALAGNYKNRLYIGGSLGITFLNFRDFRSYSEEEPTGNMDFKRLNFDEIRTVKGTGINLKLGLIYRVNKRLRVGLSMHTPTAMSLTENLDTELSGAVVWNDTLRETSATEPWVSPTAEYKQDFFSPWVFALSMGHTFGGKTDPIKGYLGIDGEYLNYAGSSYALQASDENATAGDQAFIDAVNNAITDTYQGAYRLRVGGEIAINSLRLRAGYRLQSSPYLDQVKGVNDLRHDITAGFGFRQEHVFFDLSYMRSIRDFEYSPYYATSSYNNPRTSNSETIGLFMMTLGFRF